MLAPDRRAVPTDDEILVCLGAVRVTAGIKTLSLQESLGIKTLSLQESLFQSLVQQIQRVEPDWDIDTYRVREAATKLQSSAGPLLLAKATRTVRQLAAESDGEAIGMSHASESSVHARKVEQEDWQPWAGATQAASRGRVDYTEDRIARITRSNYPTTGARAQSFELGSDAGESAVVDDVLGMDEGTCAFHNSSSSSHRPHPLRPSLRWPDPQPAERFREEPQGTDLEDRDSVCSRSDRSDSPGLPDLPFPSTIPASFEVGCDRSMDTGLRDAQDIGPAPLMPPDSESEDEADYYTLTSGMQARLEAAEENLPDQDDGSGQWPCPWSSRHSLRSYTRGP
jgi:hypothetical protein